jgi:hypothetical protein
MELTYSIHIKIYLMQESNIYKLVPIYEGRYRENISLLAVVVGWQTNSCFAFHKTNRITRISLQLR